MAERVINMGIRNQNSQATLMKIRGILKTPFAFKKLVNDLVPRYRCNNILLLIITLEIHWKEKSELLSFYTLITMLQEWLLSNTSISNQLKK